LFPVLPCAQDALCWAGNGPRIDSEASGVTKGPSELEFAAEGFQRVSSIVYIFQLIRQIRLSRFNNLHETSTTYEDHAAKAVLRSKPRGHECPRQSCNRFLHYWWHGYAHYGQRSDQFAADDCDRREQELFSLLIGL